MLSRTETGQCVFYVNNDVEVSVNDTVLLCEIFAHCCSPNHKAKPVFKGLGLKLDTLR